MVKWLRLSFGIIPKQHLHNYIIYIHTSITIQYVIIIKKTKQMNTNILRDR